MISNYCSLLTNCGSLAATHFVILQMPMTPQAQVVPSAQPILGENSRIICHLALAYPLPLYALNGIEYTNVVNGTPRSKLSYAIQMIKQNNILTILEHVTSNKFLGTRIITMDHIPQFTMLLSVCRNYSFRVIPNVNSTMTFTGVHHFTSFNHSP